MRILKNAGRIKIKQEIRDPEERKDEKSPGVLKEIKEIYENRPGFDEI